MKLTVRKALTGVPDDGDIVDLVMTDGRILTLVYDPHDPHDHYVWRVQFGDKLSETKPLFAALEERGVEARSVTCYLNCVREIVVGEPLHLFLVPHALMSDWPQVVTRSSVADITIR